MANGGQRNRDRNSSMTALPRRSREPALGRRRAGFRGSVSPSTAFCRHLPAEAHRSLAERCAAHLTRRFRRGITKAMSPTAAYPETVDRAFPASMEGGESVAGWNCVIKGPAWRELPGR